MNLEKIKDFLKQPVDIAGLVVFRIAFGLIMTYEVYRYFDHKWIKRYFIDPTFYFNYEGFGWLSPWSGDGMYYHFYMLGICAFFIAIGFLYRISTVCFFFGFSYIFLLDKTNHLNHFYLIILLSFILIWLPANRAFSVDSKIWPKIKSDWTPYWALWWLRIQLGIVYTYGGIAKINSDWLQCEPMRRWLANRRGFPIIGQWFDQEWMVYIFTYGGLLIDLFIFPLLMFKRTRAIAIVLILSFHLLNSQLFSIGIFPWFMIAATAVFFPPEKLRFWTRSKKDDPIPYTITKPIFYGIGIYVFIQLMVPLRHHLFAGNVNWTEEGHRFAWHMKLRGKSTDTKFLVNDLDKKTVRQIDIHKYLTKRQRRKIPGRPDMILQFARYMRGKVEASGLDNFTITVNAKCSLNGRPKTDLIDSTVDLSKEEYPFYKKADWILPLTVPLKPVSKFK